MIYRNTIDKFKDSLRSSGDNDDVDKEEAEEPDYDQDKDQLEEEQEEETGEVALTTNAVFLGIRHKSEIILLSSRV
ncbi:MAG TPA: hypothetical protein VE619_09405, partial [Nitrososphaeraceae archaeon]|nr:hypothetical protein [Nitrososphaeraceae archaeon]